MFVFEHMDRSRLNMPVKYIYIKMIFFHKKTYHSNNPTTYIAIMSAEECSADEIVEKSQLSKDNTSTVNSFINTLSIEDIYRAQKICREYIDKYRWGAVGHKGMKLHVLYSNGYTTNIHHDIIDKFNSLSSGGIALRYFKIDNLERFEGGFNLVAKDKYALEDYRNQAAEYTTITPSTRLTIRCNLMEQVNKSAPSKIIPTIYRNKHNTNIVTYKADSDCPLAMMMCLRMIVETKIKEALIIREEGYPSDDDDIWSTNSLWNFIS